MAADMDTERSKSIGGGGPVDVLVHVLLAILCGMFLLPFLILVSDSLKSFQESFAVPRVWFPSPPRFDNFVTIFTQLNFFKAIYNTICITALALSGQVISACIVGYSFARLRWPFRETCFIILLSTLMLPGEVRTIPIFLLFNELGWVNTWKPIFVPAWFGINVFNVFLMRQFFKSIPYSLEEAARMDGASYVRILTTIMLPLVKPAVVSISILGFIHWWNDFFGPLIYLSDHNKYPISLFINMFKSSQSVNPQLIMASSLVALMPVLIIFFSAQRYFVKGIALTGVKG